MGPHTDFLAVMALLFESELRPVIDSSFPLAEASAAHLKLQSGDFFGKILLVP
jgi:NADPH:quinone reductase-like Zn-dependent oxidoreductase